MLPGCPPQVLAKIDQEHRETEEARVHAEADVVRYRHTQAALEVRVPATFPHSSPDANTRGIELMLKCTRRNGNEDTCLIMFD